MKAIQSLPDSKSLWNVCCEKCTIGFHWGELIEVCFDHGMWATNLQNGNRKKLKECKKKLNGKTEIGWIME